MIMISITSLRYLKSKDLGGIWVGKVETDRLRWAATLEPLSQTTSLEVESELKLQTYAAPCQPTTLAHNQANTLCKRLLTTKHENSTPLLVS